MTNNRSWFNRYLIILIIFEKFELLSLTKKKIHQQHWLNTILTWCNNFFTISFNFSSKIYSTSKDQNTSTRLNVPLYFNSFVKLCMFMYRLLCDTLHTCVTKVLNIFSVFMNWVFVLLKIGIKAKSQNV